MAYKKLVPEAKKAMENFKNEIASEVGVTLKNGYNGELTARQAGAIGGNMVKESLSKEEDEECSACFKAKTMIPMAIATSIDALVAGIGFIGAGDLNVPLTIIAVGVFTFATSAIGVKIGNVFGARYKSKAELAGGIVLCGMGLKFLIEGLMETM